jgi:hypothetical protein
VQYLALKIGETDVIEFDQTERADACGGQIQRDWRPQSAGADEQHPRRLQATLASLADLRQQDVPTIPHQLFAAKLVVRNAFDVHVVVYWAMIPVLLDANH